MIAQLHVHVYSWLACRCRAHHECTYMYMHVYIYMCLLPEWRYSACLATSTRRAASCAGNSYSVSFSPGSSSSARSSRASSRRARCVLCAYGVRTACVLCYSACVISVVVLLSKFLCVVYILEALKSPAIMTCSTISHLLPPSPPPNRWRMLHCYL